MDVRSVSNRLDLRSDYEEKLNACVNFYAQDLCRQNLLARIWDAVCYFFNASKWQQMRSILAHHAFVKGERICVQSVPDSYHLSEFVLRYLVTKKSLENNHSQLYFSRSRFAEIQHVTINEACVRAVKGYGEDLPLLRAEGDYLSLLKLEQQDLENPIKFAEESNLTENQNEQLALLVLQAKKLKEENYDLTSIRTGEPIAVSIDLMKAKVLKCRSLYAAIINQIEMTS